ncbi:hypothetical protein HDC92_000273 [Pedobacter sp. AK017]|uniref:hypothetical protein n=1 Tax=Pedobacter sp. AK017 TaxID=2723073 RepID=UPI001607BE42|nr:hypothetical protein [Pedobacter sp. AK017]MBB5436609.1 hypothetical protein [Pedobacter sp. AK017]
MKNKAISLIAILTVVAVAVVFFFSLKDRKNNGFTRNLVESEIIYLNSIELPDNSFVFAGKLNEHILLNRYLDRLNLFQANYSLNKIDKIPIKFPKNFKSSAFNIYKDVFASYIFCTNPYGDILTDNGTQVKSYNIKNYRFDVFQALSEESIIVRARYKSKESVNRSLAKLKLSDSVKILKEYSLPDLSDGLFANDGILDYDQKNAKMLYMYFYRGEVLCLDTNLNMKYILKTIDTVRTAHIKLGISVNKGKDNKISKMLTQRTPPKFINAHITTNDDKIYVLSRLKADNESQKEFDNQQVIDKYNIYNGKYINSFYLPKYKGKKLKQFQIRNNLLVAIYGTTLVTYKIRE